MRLHPALVALATVCGLGSAIAADLPVKAPSPYSPVPVWNWSGFYLGAHLGGAFGNFRNNSPTFAGPGGSSGSVMGGGQLGYN
jgi:outer membrane immunogenic protein